jgi:putative lysine transport system permease protein
MAVMSGDIDAIIAGMSPTAERQQTLDFTDPYYESELVVVVRKDGKYAAATQLSDFAGARITANSTPFIIP